MNWIRFFLATTIFFSLLNSSFTQIKKEKQTVTVINFEKDRIYLNYKYVFDYKKNANHFVISEKKGEPIIEGYLQMVNGVWKSKINFLLIDESFSNDKIVDRNDLIFALAEENVFTKKLKIDKQKLKQFIVKYNQLE